MLALAVLLSFVSCSKKAAQSQVVRIGVTGAMYDDIWAPAISSLKEQDIEVQLVQFADYVAPSKALEDGDVIAIPNEATNEGRSLKLLDSAGIIQLKAGSGFNPTLEDIASIPCGVTFRQLASNTIPPALVDVAAAIINGGYALDFGIDPNTAIVSETKPDTAYWNLIAARTADLSDKTKVAVFDKIVKAFQTEETKRVFEEKFGGYFQSVGWEIDELAAYK